MEREVYPNACIICYEIKDLKRCSRCQMVSYCGLPHQQEHWTEHKDVCRAISSIAKERKVSHIFEKLKGVDSITWRKQRLALKTEAENRCIKKFTMNDDGLFKFPRSCFVCHESRQSLLKSCPNCPTATFCQNHPTSKIHNEDCEKMREIFESLLRFLKHDTLHIQMAIAFTVYGSAVFKPKQLPITTEEFMLKFVSLSRVEFQLPNDFNKLNFKFESMSQLERFNITNQQFPDELKLHVSELVSTSLTCYEGLKKLNFPRCTELTIFAYTLYDCTNAWELLFHFMPHLKVINILQFESCKDFVKDEFSLCPNCTAMGKIMNINFMTQTYEVFRTQHKCEPNVFIHSNILESEKGQFLREKELSLLKIYSKMNCPFIMTTITKDSQELLTKAVKSLFEDKEIIFDGDNSYKSLLHQRNTDDGRIGLSNQCMLVLKKKGPIRKKLTCQTPTPPVKTKISSKIRNVFYSSVCHVCASSNASVICKRCRMISYCGKQHQEEHQAQHKDLCKSILGILNESGAPNLFDKLKTGDVNLWLRAKLQLLMRAKSRVGRELLDFEKQMFLFPKTCFVCHESDLSVLRNCECGVYLCKIHKSNQEHKILCNDLSLAFKLSIAERPEISNAIVKKLNPQENKISMSMDNCIDSLIKFETNLSHIDIKNIEKILISDFLTRPFTLLWCLEKLNYKLLFSLTIHVIGAKNIEVTGQKYWKTILYRFHSLKSLKIIFIGPEITNVTSLAHGLEFPSSSLAGKHFQIETHAMKYEDFIKSKSFTSPTLIIGFNLHLHEIDYGLINNTWKETILSLKKINAPFILTAGTETRAQKDHEKFCQLFEGNTEFLCCEKNPFAGLIPERDFENEKLLYSNQYVIIYNKLYESLKSKGLKMGSKSKNQKKRK